MKFLTKEEVEKYIQEADGLRTDYINSHYYSRDLCDTVFQHLNLKENDCHTEFVYEFQTEIEFMALYQQLIDVCPEAFSGREQELIKDSLQKSIYASIRPKLFPNYLTELENNNPDSFLIIPAILKNIPNSIELHGVTLILMKKENQFVVSIFDKARERAEENKSRINIYETQNRTTYRYTIEDTENNVASIANILHLGLGYPKEENQRVESALMGFNYSLYFVFRSIAKREKLCTHIGMGQFYQGNCSINNLNGALKYVLGEAYPVKDLMLDGERAVKTKYKDLSTEKYNSIIVQIVFAHLIKLEGSFKSIRLLKDAYAVYHLLKKTRSKNTDKLDKFEEKIELSKYLRIQSKKYVDVVPTIPIGDPVTKEELGSLYKLTKEEIHHIREHSDNLLKNPGQPVSKSTISKIAEVHEGILLERKFKDILTR